MKIEDVWQEWIVEKKIGRGSYGTVYKCFKEENGERIYAAIKVISVPGDDVELQSNGSLEHMTAEQSKTYYKEIVDGFVREISILESLKGHPNIVRVDDSVIAEDENGIGWHLFIRMELLTDFNTYSCDKSFSEKDVIKMAVDLGNALKACAEQNIIHRDIKPENIFVDENGTFKLGDFGVAKQLKHTQTALSRKGTLNYMAPEVLNAQVGDSRTDIYSLGIVMYQLLNHNRLPFLDPNKQFITHSEREKAFKRRTISGEKLHELQNVSSELNAIVLKATQFKKEDRFRTIEEFTDALDLLVGKKKSAKIRRLRWSKRRKAGIALFAILLIFALSCGVFAIVNPKMTQQIVACVSMQMLSEDKRVERKRDYLGENGSYSILNSGLINGLFTFKSVDYYADSSGLYSAAKGEEPKQLTNKSCLSTFSIIKDKIFFTASNATASGEEVQTTTKYSCWSMDLDGGHQERLFTCQGFGLVVYESPNAVYYLDYKKGSTDKSLKCAQKKDYSKKAVIKEKVDDVAFCDYYLMFNRKGVDGRSTEAYTFDVWKAEDMHHFKWETMEATPVDLKIISKDNASTLVALNDEALLAFVEYEDYDHHPIALSILDSKTNQWHKIMEVQEGIIHRMVDSNTFSVRLKKNDSNQEQYYMYSYSKDEFDSFSPESGLTKPLITDVVFSAFLSKTLRYELRETNEGEYYLSKTNKKNVTTYTNTSQEFSTDILIGQNVLLKLDHESAITTYDVSRMDSFEWSDTNPDKLFLGEEYNGVSIEYLSEPIDGFIYRSDSIVNLRYAPDINAAPRNEKISANHADRVLIMSEKVSAGKYKYVLCQRQSDGRKSWVYADRVFEGTFGEYENLKYAVVDGKKNSLCVAITGVVDKDELKGRLEIPKSIIGIDVTQINPNAFESCQNLKSVVLPERLNEIGDRAFGNCQNLESINLDSVLWIDYAAFECCYSLSSVNLSSVRVLSPSAFCECTSLKSVVLPDSDYFSIDESTFAECTKLTSISPGPSDWAQRDWQVSGTAFYGCKTDFYNQFSKAKAKIQETTQANQDLEISIDNQDKDNL